MALLGWLSHMAKWGALVAMLYGWIRPAIIGLRYELCKMQINRD